MAVDIKYKNEIANYLRAGELTSAFVMSVLTNDLMAFITTATDEEVTAVKDLVLHVYSHVPAEAWGSRKKLMEWRIARQTERGVPISPNTMAELEMLEDETSPLVEPRVLKLVAG